MFENIPREGLRETTKYSKDSYDLAQRSKR
jgi:hypothetical protein